MKFYVWERSFAKQVEEVRPARQRGCYPTSMTRHARPGKADKQGPLMCDACIPQRSREPYAAIGPESVPVP